MTYTVRPRTSEGLKAVSCTGIIGAKVVNLQGKDLGDLHDLAIDWEAGCIAYAVLAHDIMMGISRKLFAIPWEAFSLRNQEEFVRGGDRTLILNIPEEALKEADSFDQENWPLQPDYIWLREVYDRYGFKPYWEMGRGAK